MDEAERKAKAKAADVVLRMREFTKTFVCPISYDDGQVKLQGTGSFLNLLGKTFLLSNEHVLFRDKPMLAHGIYGTDSVFRLQGLNASIADPYDIGIFDVSPAWNHSHQGQTLGEEHFAPCHSAVQDEIIFFKGYAKEESNSFTRTCLAERLPTPHRSGRTLRLVSGLTDIFSCTTIRRRPRCSTLTGACL